MNLQDYKGVFVFVQQVDGKVTNVSYELIGKAKELAADLGTEVTAVLLGHQVDGLCKPLAEYGADRIIKIDDKLLETYMTEPYAYCMAETLSLIHIYRTAHRERGRRLYRPHRQLR